MNKAVFILALLLALPCRPASAQDNGDVCKTTSLPSHIERRLENDFAGFDIQQPVDLNAEASERWQALQPLTCPGMASGHFASASYLSYAFLLVSPITGRFKLVLFFTEDSAPLVLNRSPGNADVDRFFIRAMPVASLLRPASLRKFQPRAPDGILLVGADKDVTLNRSDAYFATMRGFRFAPVEY